MEASFQSLGSRAGNEGMGNRMKTTVGLYTGYGNPFLALRATNKLSVVLISWERLQRVKRAR